MRRLARSTVALALLVAPASARADVERIALHYEASGACPSESEFLATVRSHTQRWSHVPEGTPASRTIRVRVSEGPTETVGKLAVSSPNAELSERDIVGPTCAEVSRALAVMVAVTIDPRAGRIGDGKKPHSSDDAPAVERPAEQAPAISDRGTLAPTTRGAPRRNEGPRVALDLRMETTSAVIRGGLPGLGASLTIDAPVASLPRWLDILKPSFAVGMRQSLPKERSLGGGSVEFLWTAGHVRVCPFRVAIASALELSACAESNIGILRASASGFAESRVLSSFWLDLGGSVWATVNLSERFFLSSTVLVTVPTSRQPISLASGTVVASTPALGVLFGLGIGAKM